MFVAFGTGVALIGGQCALGTAERMGPGYFPATVGALLALVGIGVAIGALARTAAVEKVGKFALSTPAGGRPSGSAVRPAAGTAGTGDQPGAAA